MRQRQTTAFTALQQRAARLGLIVIKRTVQPHEPLGPSRTYSFYTVTTPGRLRRYRGDPDKAVWIAGSFERVYFFLRGFQEGRAAQRRGGL